MILYIAGPMSNLVNSNLPAFNAAEAQLRDNGYKTLNPARHEQDGRTWQEYMRLGIRDVTHAEGVALLPGWGMSKGAQLERTVALSLGIPVNELEEWL